MSRGGEPGSLAETGRSHFYWPNAFRAEAATHWTRLFSAVVEAISIGRSPRPEPEASTDFPGRAICPPQEICGR